MFICNITTEQAFIKLGVYSHIEMFLLLLIGQMRMIVTSPLVSRIRWLNSLPSSMRKSSVGFRMPHLTAMDRAVFTLSPVTMRTVMPAFWHFLMASGTYNRRHGYLAIVKLYSRFSKRSKKLNMKRKYSRWRIC